MVIVILIIGIVITLSTHDGDKISMKVNETSLILLLKSSTAEEESSLQIQLLAGMKSNHKSFKLEKLETAKEEHSRRHSSR